jgi:hypothetical protein
MHNNGSDLPEPLNPGGKRVLAVVGFGSLLAIFFSSFVYFWLHVPMSRLWASLVFYVLGVVLAYIAAVPQGVKPKFYYLSWISLVLATVLFVAGSALLAVALVITLA